MDGMWGGGGKRRIRLRVRAPCTHSVAERSTSGRPGGATDCATRTGTGPGPLHVRKEGGEKVPLRSEHAKGEA
jgi:hypothetical protein